MFLRALPTKTKRLVLFVAVLGLLFAQGARLCIHPEVDPVTGDATVASASAVHLESLPSADDGATGDNQHASLTAMLVKFSSDVSFVFLVAMLFLVGAVPRPTYLRYTFDIFPVTNGSWSLRPPLRAPPL